MTHKMCCGISKGCGLASCYLNVLFVLTIGSVLLVRHKPNIKYSCFFLSKLRSIDYMYTFQSLSDTINKKREIRLIIRQLK